MCPVHAPRTEDQRCGPCEAAYDERTKRPSSLEVWVAGGLMLSIFFVPYVGLGLIPVGIGLNSAWKRGRRKKFLRERPGSIDRRLPAASEE